MEINAQFQKFFDFARTAHAEGKDKRITRVSEGPELPAEGTGLNGRTTDAARGDRVAPLWRSRTAPAWAG